MKNIHIYSFINYNHWLPVVMAVRKSSSGGRVTSDSPSFLGELTELT